MAKLTTHVLDTASGKPAAGVTVRLYRCATGRELCATHKTNADGRTDGPLLDESSLLSACYELEFDVADYFAAAGAALDDPPFLDTVVIRVALREGQNYHVPLLVSPWSYSTYRGS